VRSSAPHQLSTPLRRLAMRSPLTTASSKPLQLRLDLTPLDQNAGAHLMPR
jgi:hypothetical protein